MIETEFFLSISNLLTENYIYLITCMSVLLLIYWLFKPKVVKPEYSKYSYWEKRYSILDKKFEWYASCQKIFQDFELDKYLVSNVSKTKKIIELGCGSSSLAYDLANIGYKNIFAIDYSEKVINVMRKNFNHPNIEYLCLDFFNLTSSFVENEIDCVIDKAGLDTINTLKNIDEIKAKMLAVFTQLYKVMKEGGILITISNKNPEYWNEIIHQYLYDKQLFKVVENKKSTFSMEGKSLLMCYYLIILKKIKK